MAHCESMTEDIGNFLNFAATLPPISSGLSSQPGRCLRAQQHPGPPRPSGALPTREGGSSARRARQSCTAPPRGPGTARCSGFPPPWAKLRRLHVFPSLTPAVTGSTGRFSPGRLPRKGCGPCAPAFCSGPSRQSPGTAWRHRAAAALGATALLAP